MATLEITGGEAVARMLKAHQVGPMFGMAGFQLLPFYDAARRIGLQHNLINDERCAVLAADAYAKVSNRVGVADATLGPGATNLVTGLVEAFNAGSALVVIVGDAHRGHAGKNMTQESGQVDILKPACKELLRIEAVERIPELLRRAFAIATSGRPGPVVVNVPEDISHAVHKFEDGDFFSDLQHTAVPALRCRPDADSTAEAVARIRAAKRPLLLCGGGVHISAAQAELTNFAESFSIPVAYTLTGKGALSGASPLSIGLFGRYDRIANPLVEASDCLIVVGCKLGEIATKRYTIPQAGAPVIHLDNVAEEMGRTFDPVLKLWGDAREGLTALHELMTDSAEEQRAVRADYLEEVRQCMEAWKQETASKLYSEESPVHMARLVTELNKLLPEDGYLIADGGFAAHWAGLLFDTKVAARRFVPGRGTATIGYGLPGAIGTQLAAPDSVVIGLTGDGGFNMSLGDLETARRMNLPVILMIVNNACQGYVKAIQHAMYGEENYQSADLFEMNYAKVAEAMGCQGIRVDDPAELEEAITAAMAERNRPTVIDVVVTRDPGKMLPGVDSRTVKIVKGDRIA